MKHAAKKNKKITSSLNSLYGSYKSEETAEEIIEVLKAARTFNRKTERFDLTIEKSKKANSSKASHSLPVTFAEHPNVSALAGIWKNKDISLAELRKKAWGDRM